MNPTHLALAALLLGTVSASAAPPGHLSTTTEFLSSVVDFKDGAGIADPVNGSPCDAVVRGLRASAPSLPTWTVDQNMGTNLNGPAIGISNLGYPPFAPPLAPVGGGFPNSYGLPLGVIPGCGPGVMWLVWSGMNWRGAEADSTTELQLCTRLIGPCFPLASPSLLLVAAACIPTSETFAHTYTDAKDKNGGTDDALRLKNDALRCPIAHAHDYTASVVLGASSATLDPDLPIKNEAVVHAFSGTTYMAICWRLDYLDFTNPLNPVARVAHAHDWKLIVDTGDNPLAIATAVAIHYGPQRLGDTPAVPATFALRGFYSHSTPIGENGFGPCPTAAPLPEAKKPTPIL